MTRIASSLSLLLALASTSTPAVESFTSSATIGTTASLSSSTSTTTSSTSCSPSTSSSSSSSALHVSVVSEFLSKDEAEAKLQEAFEVETPESTGLDFASSTSTSSTKSSIDTTTNNNKQERRSNRNHRKHNYRENKAFLQESPDTDFYTLHSSAVSHLYKEMPINDIMRAIKRAQNLHDSHDLGTIAAFLIEECQQEEGWGYGFRGSLLSRLAVAACHMEEVDIALRAIQTRKQYERSSMQPHESAGIVRGLLRVQQIDHAWEVLNDELPLPTTQCTVTNGSDNDIEEEKEEELKNILTHRSRSLASIVSRYFYNGTPSIASKALRELELVGEFLSERSSSSEFSSSRWDITLPWSRLINAASSCQEQDMSDLVFETMAAFPCPHGEELCSLEDFLVMDDEKN